MYINEHEILSNFILRYKFMQTNIAFIAILHFVVVFFLAHKEPNAEWMHTPMIKSFIHNCIICIYFFSIHNFINNFKKNLTCWRLAQTTQWTTTVRKATSLRLFILANGSVVRYTHGFKARITWFISSLNWELTSYLRQFITYRFLSEGLTHISYV